MFCGKCGRQLEDGAVCTCQQQPQFNNQAQYANQQQYVNQPVNNVTPDKALIGGFSLVKIATLGLAALTFLSHLIFNWYNVKISSFLSYSDGFGPYAGPSYLGVRAPLAEVSGLFGFVRVLVILNILVFLAYIVWEVVDLKKYIPALASLKFDLGKLLSLVFYGLMAVSLFFGLIGVFAAEDGVGVSVRIGLGWFITGLFTAAGLVNFFMPQLLKDLLAKIKK